MKRCKCSIKFNVLIADVQKERDGCLRSWSSLEFQRTASQHVYVQLTCFNSAWSLHNAFYLMTNDHAFINWIFKKKEKKKNKDDFVGSAGHLGEFIDSLKPYTDYNKIQDDTAKTSFTNYTDRIVLTHMLYVCKHFNLKCCTTMNALTCYFYRWQHSSAYKE